MQDNKPPDPKKPVPTAFEAAAMPAFKLLGKNYQTPDLVAKVTGKAKYAEADTVAPAAITLLMKLRRETPG